MGYSVFYFIENSELKKYFFIHDVKNEMFKVCEEVFDLEIRSESNQTAWHEDVELWSLWEKNGEQLAYFYLDLYPREGKFTHLILIRVIIRSVETRSCSHERE